ncbi:hypothetical protein [Burkholderia gladioli]|uniref:hypothetical protein n=1 Tax=Burkholderia gladioli TaxID=28095 RepID=UPI002FE0BE54
MAKRHSTQPYPLDAQVSTADWFDDLDELQRSIAFLAAVQDRLVNHEERRAAADLLLLLTGILKARIDTARRLYL